MYERSTTVETSLMPTALTSSSPQKQTIRLGEWGPDVTGRSLGEQVRAEISPDAVEVLFDCEGVDSVSPSFADELFGKLAAKPRRPHIRIVNGSPDIIAAIRFAVRERSA
jgi:hypothetical protein